MKNILNVDNQNLIINRINSLSLNSQKLWGKMSINQMVCHCTDQIKMAEGKIEIIFVGNFFLTKIMKNLILLGFPAPKGKIKTYEELDQLVSGTKPTNLENDKLILTNAIKSFNHEYPVNTNVVHPSFGKMSKKDWGRLIYAHLDHHLKQFGA